MQKEAVLIVKDRGSVMVLTKDKPLAYELRNQLCYTKFTFLRSYQDIRDNNGNKERFDRIHCYEPIVHGEYTGLTAAAGFLPRLVDYCKSRSVSVRFKDSQKGESTDKYQINPKVLAGYTFRGEQMEVLRKIVKRERCRISWPTGAGKSFLIAVLCRLFYKARILVTVKSITNAKDLHKEIVNQGLHAAGLRCSAKFVPMDRVNVVSTGSLHNVDPTEYDIIMADEIHELATENYLENLSKFAHCRAFGFSANIKDRQDNADFEMEGVFGPVAHIATYKKATDSGMITDIKIGWFGLKVSPERDPSRGYSIKEFDRRAYWAHERRNKRIAGILNKFTKSQILVPVRTLEHAVHLKVEMPDAALVYAPTSSNAEKIRHYIAAGLLPEGTVPLTPQSADKLKAEFEQGKIRKAIATTVWDKGVNFPQLSILFMADPSSKIFLTQRAGRLSRLFAGKSNGWILQLKDDFNDSVRRKVVKCRQFYRSQGWEQVELGRKPRR